MEATLIGISGTIVAALLAFLLGRVNLARAYEHERSESLRHERIRTFATFCAAVVEYRRAQLHRWFVGADHGNDPRTVEERRPDVAEDVRNCRAAAWSAFYRLLMICDDDALAVQARETLALTKSMKEAKSPQEVSDRSDRVHSAVEAFARAARSTTTTRRGASG